MFLLRRRLTSCGAIAGLALFSNLIAVPPRRPILFQPGQATSLSATPVGRAAAAYRIQANLDPAARRLSGQLALQWRNDFEPTKELRFRLHLNAWRDARSTWMRAYLADQKQTFSPSDYGFIDVRTFTFRDRGSNVDLSAATRFVAPDGNPHDRTVMAVELPRFIAHGEVANFSLAFNVGVPSTKAGIGIANGQIILSHWFPEVAIYDTRGWSSGQARVGVEPAAEEADFEVSLTIPRGWQVAATGKPRASVDGAGGLKTHAFLQNAVRDFALALSPAYREDVTRLSEMPVVDVRVLLQPEHVHQTGRIVEAAREALMQYGEWFTPYPDDHLTIVDVPWQSGAGGRAYPRLITVDARWLSRTMSQDVEAQVARGIARQWWGGTVGIDVDEDVWLAASLAQYAQSRTLERLFDRRYQVVAYAVYESRFFGGFIPWAPWDLRLRREMSGLVRPSESLGPVARGALAFGTLERYLGWPTLQRALRAVARQSASRLMSRHEFFRTFNEAAGQDLTWFFDEAFGGSEVFDYAVDRFSSERQQLADCAFNPCFLTTVVTTRNGTALFTGTGRPPTGRYESGRALEVRVTFADGQQVSDHWDGRSREKTFVYQSPTPAVSAAIDPNRTLLLDVNYLNNGRTLRSASNRAALKWSVKWLVWLQDLLLTYASLI